MGAQMALLAAVEVRRRRRRRRRRQQTRTQMRDSKGDAHRTCKMHANANVLELIITPSLSPSARALSRPPSPRVAALTSSGKTNEQSISHPTHTDAFADQSL